MSSYQAVSNTSDSSAEASSPQGKDSAKAQPPSQDASRKKGGSMKIGAKIYALVGLCLGLLGMVAGTGIWQMNKIGVEIEGIAERDLPLTRGLTQVTIYQLEQAVNLERAFRTAELMSRQPGVREEFGKSVRTFEELVGRIGKEFEETVSVARYALETATTREGREEFQNVLNTLEKLVIEHKDYDKASLKAFKLIQADNLDQANAMLPAIEAEQEELTRGLEKLLLGVEDFTGRAAKTAESHERFALMLMMIIAAIAVIAGTGASVFLVKRSISRPLGEIITGLNALNADDMSVEVKVHSDDEIGAVAKAYAAFKETLARTKKLEADQAKQKQRAEEEKREMMSKLADEFDENVGGIVGTVSSASAELNATAQSMASISEETSSQASAVAAASEEASANVQTVAAATEEMSNTIQEINSQVADASQASKKAVEDVSATAVQMNTLAQTADKIGDVISLIQDIAEQTNLLALNATIESARAGEAGKGFAVVASEVKALANETAKATESISGHIEEIQAATADAVCSIDGIGKVIGQIEESSTAIAAAMEEQGATTQEVARNVQEAAKGTQEVTSNISGVTQASQEAGAASGQVTSAASELSSQAELMKTEVSKFIEQVRAA